MDAKGHMQKGIACLQKREWEVALQHFDSAVELREAIPWRDDVEAAWLLAAAWINRSDAQRALGRAEEALASLDRGIDAMDCVPWREHAAYAERLILAWTNRATLCGGTNRTKDAFAGFEKAHEVLQATGGASNPRRKLQAAMLHMNRARVSLGVQRIRDGWIDARAAVDYLTELEPDPVLSDASIRARSLLCKAMAMMLDEPGGKDIEADWIATATDRTEEALAIAREAGDRSPWVADLVRYGARIYRVCQPHFLGEFLCEWLAPGRLLAGDTALADDMLAEVALAKTELVHRIVARLHETPVVDRARVVLASFQKAEIALGAGPK